MMLTLQIAAGIVLAYIIITNGRTLLKFAGSLAVVGTVIALVALGSWGVSSAFTAMSLDVSQILAKLGMLIVVLIMFSCMAAGGFGLLWAVHEVFKRPGVYLTKTTVGIAVAINCVVVTLAGFASSATPVGGWIDAADRWSRDNGYADGASVSIFAISCLWPYVVVLILRAIRGRFIVTHLPGNAPATTTGQAD